MMIWSFKLYLALVRAFASLCVKPPSEQSGLDQAYTTQPFNHLQLQYPSQTVLSVKQASKARCCYFDLLGGSVSRILVRLTRVDVVGVELDLEVRPALVIVLLDRRSLNQT